MPFEIIQDESGMFPVICLKDNSSGCSAEIYSFGASLNAFYMPLKNELLNIIDGYTSPADAAENVTRGFKSSKLSPFVCRLKKGTYSADGTVHTIRKFYLGEEALHGLLYDCVFTVKSSGADEEKAFVTLHYHYNKQEEGFPFPFTMEVTYTLHKNFSVAVQTTVTNNGTSAMPLSDGWHPYFQMGCPVNDLLVRFNSNSLVEFDNKLLPTGNYIADARFEYETKINNTVLDNCFVLKNSDSSACTITNAAKKIRLTVTADSSYPYLQVYTPDNRKSIAIENLSSPPDAFNNKIGLIILQPAASKTFTTNFSVELL